MRSISRHLVLAFTTVLVGGALAAAQSMGGMPMAAAPAGNDITKPILESVKRSQANFMALAQAMPADKYTFAPSNSDVFRPGSPAKFDTVRTFAQTLNHVSSEAYFFLGGFGVKPDPAVDPKTFGALTDKDEILKTLQASFDYEDKVIAGITPENAFTPTGPRGASLMSAVVGALNDAGDHYGQLVEYARMNGIVPPSTEKQMQRMKMPQPGGAPK